MRRLRREGCELPTLAGEAYARPKNSGTLLTTGGTALATFINEFSTPVTVVRLGGGHLAAHLNCPAQVREDGVPAKIRASSVTTTTKTRAFGAPVKAPARAVKIISSAPPAKKKEKLVQPKSPRAGSALGSALCPLRAARARE